MQNLKNQLAESIRLAKEALAQIETSPMQYDTGAVVNARDHLDRALGLMMDIKVQEKNQEMLALTEALKNNKSA